MYGVNSRVASGAIAPSGYAFEYVGDGANGVATIGADATAEFKSLTLRSPLTVGNGGTGLSTLTANRIPFASATDTLGTSAKFTWDATTLAFGAGTAIGAPGFFNVDAAASSPRSARVVFGTDDGGWQLRLSKRNGGSTTDLWLLNDSGHFQPVTTNSFDIGGASNLVRKGYFTDLQFGTNTAKGAEAFSSFITVTDAAGNTRKLMVCA